MHELTIKVYAMKSTHKIPGSVSRRLCERSCRRQTVEGAASYEGMGPVNHHALASVATVLWQSLAFALVLALPNIAAAVEPEVIARLDEALKAVPTFEHGSGGGPLVEIEKIVFQLSTDDPSRGEIEQKLLDALASTSTADGKRFLCRQLRVIGTPQCIPALEALLSDAEVTHAAVYALGRMEFPEVDAALLRGMTKTSGDLQAGIINGLADRDCQAVKPDCVKLLASTDAPVAKAAARALGRLGGADAVSALQAARPGAAADLALEIDNGLLGCAERLVDQGENAQAADIYKTFFDADRPIQLRCAGMRGLTRTLDENQAIGLLQGGISRGSIDLSRAAISYIPLLKGEKTTLAFAGAVDGLPAEKQSLLLRALGARGDPTAAPAVVAATRSEDTAVRSAALAALGRVGDASVVSLLINAAAQAEDDQRKVARASLATLDGEDVNSRLMAAVGDSEAEAAVCVEAIHALADRKATEAVGLLLGKARGADAAVRAEAIQAIGALAGPHDIDATLKLAVELPEAEDRAVAEQSVGRALLRVTSPIDRAQPVLDALNTASPQARPTLIRLLAKSGAPQALAAVREALGDTDEAAVDAAVQSLADWPNADAAHDLLKLVAGDGATNRKTVALEGFIRLAASSDDPTSLYVRVLDHVDQVNDRKLVLEKLGAADSSNSLQVLDLARSFLDTDSLQATAGLATLRIAHRMRDSDRPQARAALDEVLAKVDHADIHKRAQEVVNDIERFDDHILQWVGVGPFTAEGKNSGQAVFQVVFEPEDPDAEDVAWQPITEGIGDWNINLEATYGGMDHVAAYVRTNVWSELEQDALLELGSDDALRVWVNGRLLWDQYDEGGVTPREKRLAVRLDKGWNAVTLKVVDHEGGWGFCCRVRHPDGTALEGLKVEAR